MLFIIQEQAKREKELNKEKETHEELNEEDVFDENKDERGGLDELEDILEKAKVMAKTSISDISTMQVIVMRAFVPILLTLYIMWAVCLHVLETTYFI